MPCWVTSLTLLPSEGTRSMSKIPAPISAWGRESLLGVFSWLAGFCSSSSQWHGRSGGVLGTRCCLEASRSHTSASATRRSFRYAEPPCPDSGLSSHRWGLFSSDAPSLVPATWVIALRRGEMAVNEVLTAHPIFSSMGERPDTGRGHEGRECKQ